MKFCLTLLITLQISLGIAHAGSTTFGTEFNFFNEEIENDWKPRSQERKSQVMLGDAESKYAQKMAEHVKSTCGDCVVKAHPGKFGLTEYEVLVKDGWGFNISVDPACVEIQTFPATATEIRADLARTEKFIFSSAEAIGLDNKIGNVVKARSAHLNIGTKSAFSDNPRVFARFLADYSNHSSLATGVLGESFYNAPPMRVLKPEQQQAFQNMLDGVNSKKIKSLQEIAKQMNFKVYTYTPGFISDLSSSHRHYQAMGLKQLIRPEFNIKDMPFELRAVRQPKTVNEHLLLNEMMDKRIDYLKSLGDTPIYYRIKSSTIKQSDLEKAADFQIYLEEMGEDWKKYESLTTDTIRAELKSGVPNKIIHGQVKWSKPEHVDNFINVMVENFHTSP